MMVNSLFNKGSITNADFRKFLGNINLCVLCEQNLWSKKSDRFFRILINSCSYVTLFLPPTPPFVLPAASYGAYPICKGCSVCSRDNGCVNCQPKLFLFLRRERMRQYGECLHDCPAGYYGMRSPELNMCSSKILSSLTYPASLIHSTFTPQNLLPPLAP